MTDQQLQDFSSILVWNTGTRLPDGRILGAPDRRGVLAAASDYRIEFLAREKAGFRGSVLEVGCGEGYHTVQLARQFEHVTASEIRPKSIACALVNLFVHDVRNARLVLGDVRELDAGVGRFDVLFHSGVLYHLMDPVDHLFRVKDIAPALLLDTHYCRDDMHLERSDLRRGGQTYRACLKAEGGWEDVFSGVEPTSRWLYRDSLLQLLQDIGFGQVRVFAEYDGVAGPRLGLWAQR